MIVKTKLSEQSEQFQIGEVHYVGRRVQFENGRDVVVSEPEKFLYVLFRLDYDRGEVFVDPSLLRPYQRPERKEEAGT